MANRIIYPENLNKYTDYIHVTPNGSYQFQIQNPCFNKILNTKEDTEEYLMRYSIENNKVKNIVYNMDMHHEVELTPGQQTKIDKNDFYIIDNHTWAAHLSHANNYYVNTNNIDGQCTKLHNAIMKFTPQTT